MDINEAIKKVILQVSTELPGYEQLLPRAQINLKYEIKKILKTLLESHNGVAKP